jgi:hypothetical protein
VLDPDTAVRAGGDLVVVNDLDALIDLDTLTDGERDLLAADFEREAETDRLLLIDALREREAGDAVREAEDEGDLDRVGETERVRDVEGETERVRVDDGDLDGETADAFVPEADGEREREGESEALGVSVAGQLLVPRV